jgi:hypothetical protein
MMQAQTNYSAVNRPLAPSELAMLRAGFNALRGVSAVFGIISLAISAFAYFYGDIVSTILALVFGLIALGMGVTVIQWRRKGAAALSHGVVTEITGFPVISTYTSSQMGSGFAARLPGWAIGPIVVADPQQRLFQQGRQARVACIPEIGMVLAIDGAQVPRMTQMTGPKRIEPTQAYGAQHQMQAPPPNIPPPLAQPYQPAPVAVCPACGAQNHPDATHCAMCGSVIQR